VSGQEREVGGQLRGHVESGEVPAVAGGFGDDAGVADIRLGLASVGAGHTVDRAAGHADGLLPVGCQQYQQQCRGRAGDVYRPVHLIGDVQGLAQRGQDRRLVILDLLRPQSRAGLVDHCGPVMALGVKLQINARAA
jgi:hypothetical protein